MTTATAGKVEMNSHLGTSNRILSESVPSGNKIASQYLRMFVEASRGHHYRIELVTPELATSWLDLNEKNRPMSPKIAKRYADIMAAGKWVPNGQNVLFSTKGTLLDGQHRLEGVVICGLSIPMGVITGINPEYFRSIDMGKKREVGQLFAMDGEKNPSALAATLKWLAVIESGGNTNARKISVGDHYTLLDLNPEIRESVALGQLKARRGIFEPSVFAAAHYVISQKHPGPMTETFFTQLFDGTNIVPGSPVHRLRDQMVGIGAKTFPSIHKLALVIKAFNFTLANKAPKSLRWMDNEPFPEIA